ncbi:WD-repeat protein [Stanieria sp. NIES-3757]|nr:WD-repeat protein [Stanieria sp. NIES-3757]
MATLREYFDFDLSKCLSLHKSWEMKNSNGDLFNPIIARIYQDFDGNSKYWSFFIQEGSDVNGYVNAIFSSPETAKCILSPEGNGVDVETGFYGYSERMSSATLVFTKRLFLYIDEFLGEPTRKQITEFGIQKGFYVNVRDKEYAMKKSELEKPLAFISHDSRDKDSLVRELAKEMSKLMCPVWYDEFSLKVGDSLRASIERGLKETRKCVVILSPNFLSNEGWGKAEFDSIYTREIIEKNNVILPVWHNVGVKDVYQYSPRLADKVGLNSSLGIQELAKKLSNVIKQNDT